MARTHSSHTASPARLRSTQHSPARRPSQDGSQYEMDLDALGLHSTFETTELNGAHEPPVDRVDTSEIEGPEDFTMNMTYWMTADLPLAQVKSRKEAHARRSGPRMDAVQEGEGQRPEPAVESNAANNSTKNEANTTNNAATDKHAYGATPSERSMENDEKVRSFLSALPDTDLEGALTGTPLHTAKHSFLQVPQSSPPKARSLQPTVEDCDTPRKPTQETVIRHTSAIIDTSEQDMARHSIAELQSRLEQQELASRTRITELETILSYTRTELDGARTDNYRHKESLTSLQRSLQEKDAEHHAIRASAENQRKSQQQAFTAKMEIYREEVRLRNLAELQSQQNKNDQTLVELKTAKQLAEKELSVKEQMMNTLQKEITQLKQDKERQNQASADSRSQMQNEHCRPGQESPNDKEDGSSDQLASIQARAVQLQRELESAIAEARVAREDAQQKDALRTAAEAKIGTLTARISDLEGHLGTARFENECAQADVAAKQQLFTANMDLNSQLRALQSELEVTGSKQTLDHPEGSLQGDSERRIDSLQTRLRDVRAEVNNKDQQIQSYMEAQEQAERQQHTSQGRIEGLEANQALLRQQLADVHRENARAMTDVERLQRDLESAEDRLREAQTEADRRVADLDKRFAKMKESKNDAESKFKTLQTQHDELVEGHEAIVADVHDRTEDALRKTGALLEQERSEKRRLLKDLKIARAETEKLRRDSVQQPVGDEDKEEESSDEDSDPSSASDTEIAKLRDIIRSQVADAKAIKSEMAALRKHNGKLKSSTDTASNQEVIIHQLEMKISELRSENASLLSRLEEQRADFEEVNRAMDEKLAAVMSRVMKERAKTVVGKRDTQWAETVERVQEEKELLGRVLLRQWGREELGVADEKHGERQGYAYKYVSR